MSKQSLTDAIHETAKGFHDAGVMSKQTMREFDTLCLDPVKHYSPREIMSIRKKLKLSQSVFAAYLNTATSTIQKWEQGQKKPSKIALKLLSIVEKHGLVVLS